MQTLAPSCKRAHPSCTETQPSTHVPNVACPYRQGYSADSLQWLTTWKHELLELQCSLSYSLVHGVIWTLKCCVWTCKASAFQSKCTAYQPKAGGGWEGGRRENSPSSYLYYFFKKKKWKGRELVTECMHVFIQIYQLQLILKLYAPTHFGGREKLRSFHVQIENHSIN